ncbi:DUF3703 domain-containing protein [Rhodococcus sp. NPDC003322]
MVDTEPKELSMTMPARVRAAYSAEMYDARTAYDEAQKWTHLEQAHILSQHHAWPHTRNHIAMLAFALRQRDWREAAGQVLRIVVAAPAAALRRYPSGNTGRTAVGLTTHVPIPEDMARFLSEAA